MELVNKEKVYTVLEINDLIKHSIRDTFPENIWVCGEIQDLRQRTHVNFTLCQKHPFEDSVVAKIKAVIFENTISYIEKRLKAADSRLSLRKDIEVKIFCRVDFYSKSGHISLVVLDIDPIYTLGKIAQSRQKIIERLKRKGLWERNKSLPVPDVPLKVGLITSFDSAAYHDFISELRNSGFGFQVYFYDSYMQGENVRRDIPGGLRFFNTLQKDELDVIVITRGGGSTADLSWFDDEKIAEAISLSRFPVLTALGHQINTTIADMVACSFYKTPTAIAQFLVFRIKEFMEAIDSCGGQIFASAEENVRRKEDELVKHSINFERFLLKYFMYSKENLARICTHLASLVERNIMHKGFTLESLCKEFSRCLFDFLNLRKREIEDTAEKVTLLSPHNILKRGFSITYKKGGGILREGRRVKKGEIVKTVLFRGGFESEVVRGYEKE